MSSLPRLALSVGCAALLVSAAALGGSVLSLAAPFSGEVYDSVDRDVDRVESPYGEATVRFDGNGVPHVQAESERALYFAVGYLQARDRLFQMDLQRRLAGGNLSGAFGERALQSDRFRRRMGFTDAARATWAGLQGTEAEPAVRAYTAGVNRYVETGPLPPEFALAGYEPRRWRPVDTLLVDKQIAWTLSGNFADLRRAVAVDRLGEGAGRLYPDRLAHDSPVIRGESDAAPFDSTTGATGPAAVGGAGPDGRAGSTASADGTRGEAGAGTRADPAAEAPTPTPARVRGRAPADSGSAARADAGSLAPLAAHLDRFDRRAGVGSNSWVASDAETGTGTATLANDPHLQLTVPPVWYEMHLSAPGLDVRGATFPGVPFVLIGRTTDVAWGLTNVGADLTDVYTYETRTVGGDGSGSDGEPTRQYRYRGEWRAYGTHTETIPVADGPDETVQVRRTVHGPVLEREGREVAVAWTGLTATNETLAIYELNHAETVTDVRRALRDWDSPPQNVVAATRAGRTLYVPAGKYPLRTVDGELVAGDRVFNGSAGHGEWRGFTPYGQSSWRGFLPFESIPRVDDPAYLGTANQRTVDDPPVYLGTSLTYADPYRGARLYDRLDARAADEAPMDAAFHRDVQADVRSRAAAQFVPYAMAPDARARMNESAAALAARLDGWDRRLTADSRAALIYRLWLEEFRTATFGDEFDAAGLDESFYPRDYTLGRLPADSRWFDDRRTPVTESRAAVAARAMNRTAGRLAAGDWADYGAYNRLELTHPFDRPFLNYPAHRTDGSPYTLDNYRRGTEVGSSWRMVVTFEGDSGATFPGGQSGVVWSDHYSDRLDEWVGEEYSPLTMASPAGPPDLVFADGDGAPRGGGPEGGGDDGDATGNADGTGTADADVDADADADAAVRAPAAGGPLAIDVAGGVTDTRLSSGRVTPTVFDAPDEGTGEAIGDGRSAESTRSPAGPGVVAPSGRDRP
jgi:penicillin amidase